MNWLENFGVDERDADKVFLDKVIEKYPTIKDFLQVVYNSLCGNLIDLFKTESDDNEKCIACSNRIVGKICVHYFVIIDFSLFV